MVQDKTPAKASKGMPAMPPDLIRIYNGMVRLGVTSPNSGRDVKFLGKQLHESRHDMEHDLHVLEGKGVVHHVTQGHDVTWYAGR